MGVLYRCCRGAVVWLALVLWLTLLAACTTTSGGAAEGDRAGEGTEDDRAGQAGVSTAELEALYRARIDSSRMRFTEADVEFVVGMIAHHAQALVMTALAPTHGAGAEVRTLAARIANAQQDEIHAMQQWLRDREQLVPEVHISGTTLMVHGADDHMMHMPGMLTQQQLDELDSARGPEFDRLFLTYMIEHHAGAVDMVQQLFATDGAARDEQIFRLASDIQVDQITEIARMERMLSVMEVSPDDP